MPVVNLERVRQREGSLVKKMAAGGAEMEAPKKRALTKQLKRTQRKRRRLNTIAEKVGAEVKAAEKRVADAAEAVAAAKAKAEEKKAPAAAPAETPAAPAETTESTES